MKSRSMARCVRWSRWLPFAVVFQQIGCLPDDALRQVLGENIVLTSAIIIQSITSIIFNTIFFGTV